MDWLFQNLDTVVKFAALAMAALGFFLGLRSELTGIRSDINYIKENQKALSEAFTQLGNILTKVAVQDVRLSMMEKKLDEMAHGQGFVKGVV